MSSAAVHEMIEGGHKADPIDDGAKRRFDESCMVPAVAVLVNETTEIVMASDHSAEDGRL
jgi:hypothetical protein